MRTYVYRATIERGDDRDWVVSFPDVPEAVTQAETIGDARHLARDALGLALLSYPERGKPLPVRRLGSDAQPADDAETIGVDVDVAPDVTAKLAVLEAFSASGRSRQELAEMLAKDEAEIRLILDPMHPTDLQPLSDALEALGRRLIVGVSDIDEAA